MLGEYCNSLTDIYGEICGFRTPHKSIATWVRAFWPLQGSMLEIDREKRADKAPSMQASGQERSASQNSLEVAKFGRGGGKRTLAVAMRN
jgi:hypothetical protein